MRDKREYTSTGSSLNRGSTEYRRNMEMQHTEALVQPTPVVATSPSDSTVRLHRLKEVRREQGVSTRRVALHLGVETDQVREQEDEAFDLTLRQLYAWQQILEVPIADLLVDTNSPLSPPVLQRARMIRLMKTATALVDRSAVGPLRKLAETLVEQLTEIMPELAGVNAWPVESERRLARAAHRIVRPSVHLDTWSD